MTEQQPKETTSATNTLDDLLSNPFSSMDELTPTQQNELSELKEQQSAPRLIDKLPQERQAQAKELASKIDVQDSQAVITYGSNAQIKLGEFSQAMLNHVQAQDIGPVGDSLTDLMFRLNEANPNELRAGEGNFIQKMLGKSNNPFTKLPPNIKKLVRKLTKLLSN